MEYNSIDSLTFTLPMKRRTLLTAGTLADARAAPQPKVPPRRLASEILRDAPPINLDQAYAEMEREDLDGIVVMDPVNVYHLTGYWPASSRMNHEPTLVAVLARDSSFPIALIAAEFTHYYLLSDIEYRYPFDRYLYTSPADPAELEASKASGYRSDVGAGKGRAFTDLKLAPLSPREKARDQAVASALIAHGASADREFALLKALRARGLDRGKVAVDHPSLVDLYAKAMLPAAVVPAADTLKRIRRIKSPREIELMRVASASNVEAAMIAARSVRSGATYQELRGAFLAEAARRGNRGVFLVVNGVSAENIDFSFEDGDAFLIDAVSEGAGYHGDFGRTVILGEPSPVVKGATDAIRTGWYAVRDALKPGMTFSEITTLGRNTLRSIEHDYGVLFQPHSVGLFHNDSPGLGEVTLEENMIISVDCPILVSGIGATAHLEDLMLITRNGAVAIHDVPESIITV